MEAAEAKAKAEAEKAARLQAKAKAKAEAEENARLEAEAETEAKNFKEKAEVVSDTAYYAELAAIIIGSIALGGIICGLIYCISKTKRKSENSTQSLELIERAEPKNL